MPFSFIEIEKRKTRIVFLFFFILLLFYFFSAWLIIVAVKFFFFAFSGLRLRSFFYFSPKLIGGIFVVALISAIFHWVFSISNVNERIIKVLGSKEPDKDDLYHKRFMNIIEEVKIASGGLNISAVVMPILAMNAFSLANFKNQGIIGITEGLLARLDRAEIEAVVAHEVAHIVSRDTLIKTVAVSIFGVYGSILAKVKNSLTETRYSYGRGRGLVFLVFMYVVLSLINSLGKIISCFISRQCEYRADSVAVRLTRDPLSLAKALYKISIHWRGAGLGYESLESIFIINPAYRGLDEKEGFFASLFSTHPPLLKRINILLDMAHADFGELTLTSQQKKPRRVKPPQPLSETQLRWFANKDGVWQGPFSASQLISLEWVTNQTFLKRENSNKICFLYQEPSLLELVHQKRGGSMLCPLCFHPLAKGYYEGVLVYLCNSCGGILVKEEKLPRILIREEIGFSSEVIEKAKNVEQLSKKTFLPQKNITAVLLCPLCRQKMLRNFYTLAVLLEVDRCYYCKVIWFDKDELEVLQYFVEKARGSIR
ncbi:MAG: hypothetical protein DRP61_02500 [Candidatus Omnitrophota bacterium]|nr:MAG: hypothetical protein DRP61_02500 [Candidatus Omnitrophota bacterium]RKY34888.1 MAG: hypothetical protein DRP69_03360 [Candidatus Omnitrophota bacterium]RKY42800.1 MAG: hypothetical protein DRP80_06320 [Candidatus Omnitrophota bacterium]